MMNRSAKFVFFVTFLFVSNSLLADISTPRPISGRDVNSIFEITPADVLARAKLIQKEVELLRVEMGRPLSSPPEFTVKDADPREVFAQALLLYKEADRLCFEIARSRGRKPSQPDGKIRSGHVFQVLDAALKQIMIVKQEIGIPEKAVEEPQDDLTTSSDVFMIVVAINQQLNRLLSSRVDPSDTFQQVSLAINTTARLLEKFPGTMGLPTVPPFERGKQPADVYQRLLGVLSTVKRIATLSGLGVLDLISKPDKASRSNSNSVCVDVHILASLVVSEVAHLQSHLKMSPKPVDVYFPGRKFSSHVYQRVGVLESQLIELENRVRNHPHWLGT
jgi:hypothetical protein